MLGAEPAALGVGSLDRGTAVREAADQVESVDQGPWASAVTAGRHAQLRASREDDRMVERRTTNDIGYAGIRATASPACPAAPRGRAGCVARGHLQPTVLADLSACNIALLECADSQSIDETTDVARSAGRGFVCCDRREKTP